MNYRVFINKLIYDKYIWKEEKSLHSINDCNIKRTKEIIDKENLSDLKLKRMLVISEDSKIEWTGIIQNISLSIGVFGLIGVAYQLKVVRTFIKISTLNILNRIGLEEEYVLTISIALILAAVILGYRDGYNKMISNNSRVNCIQISIEELLNESKNENIKQQENYNQFKENLEKELQGFKNQNNKLIDLIEEVNEGQNNSCIIGRLLRKIL